MFLIATKRGIFAWDESFQELSPFGLEKYDIRQVFAQGRDNIYALDSVGNIWKCNSSDQWEKVEHTVSGIISALYVHPTTLDLYVGTEPPRLYLLGKKTCELVKDLMTLEGSNTWYTPYGAPPAVRSITATENAIYINIHVGGVLRTLDRGLHWVAVNMGLDLDVHQIISPPTNPGEIYAATATGFAMSEDHGNSWIVRNQGLTNLYTRGLAVNPCRSEEIIISGSTYMPDDWDLRGKQFALFRTTNKGKNWEQVKEGFPGFVEAEIDTQGVAYSLESINVVLCGVHSGTLYVSNDSGESWSRVTKKLPPISNLCAVSGSRK